MWMVKIRKKGKRKKKKTVRIFRDNSMPFRHGGLLKKDDCTQGIIYENGFVLQNDYIGSNTFNTSYNNDGQIFPMKRSVSCTSCLLCGSKTRMREIDGVLGNGVKKVASCSMCVWDVDDNKWSEGEINLLSSDEINRLSSDEGEHWSSDENDDVPFNDIYQDEPDEYVRDLEEEDGNGCNYKLKNENYYTTEYDEIETCDQYINDISLSRTSPDGGECDSTMFDFQENRVNHTSAHQIDGVLKNDKFCEISENEIDKAKKDPHITNLINKKSIKKQSKKMKTRRRTISLDKKATDELDEIFGKIQRRKTTVYESDADNENNFIFRPICSSRKSYRKTKIKKYWSVEDLSSKDCGLSVGILSRSQSTLELSKLIENSENTEHTENTNSTSELLIALDEQGLHERWVEYLHTIGGLKTFVGNKSLRYIWQQIMLFHEDLQHPLEEFLKTNLEKSQQFYTSYQELEEVLEQKTEQQEKETAKIYNDFELTLQQEKDELQKVFTEKEDVAKKETQKLVHSKQQEIETLVQLNSVLNDRIKQLELVNEELKVNKDKIELQCSRVTGNHSQVMKDNEALNEVNNALVEKMTFYDLILKEQEDHVCNVNKQYETMKENCRETKHLNHGLNEENEFMKLTITNLTAELDDLKAKNKLIQERTSSVSSSHGHFLCNSDELADSYYENSYNDEMKDVVPDTLNSTFNNKHNSLMEEVTPFLVESSPIKSPNLNFNKSLLSPSNRTPSAVRRTQRNTAPGKLRLASSKQTDYKVIFTGDANVGKTSLIRRICHGKFRASREVTFEPDCSTKELEYNDQKLQLKLWDTLGQERFNSIPPSYFRKSDIVILMYDIAEEGSFINAKTWIRTIHDYTNENIFILLVASKSDLHHKRMVSSKKGQDLAKDNDAMFVETSAKTGENIQSLCQMIASTLVSREETVFIRKDFENSLCSLTYSMSHHNTRRATNCCA